MKFLMTIFLSLNLLLAGCGGRDPNPVASREHGDNKLSCEDIEYELIEIQEGVDDLIGERNSSQTSNIGWGIAGLFFPPLWLGLDITKTEEIEIRAYEKRARVLEQLARNKNCWYNKGPIRYI